MKSSKFKIKFSRLIQLNILFLTAVVIFMFIFSIFQLPLVMAKYDSDSGIDLDMDSNVEIGIANEIGIGFAKQELLGKGKFKVDDLKKVHTEVQDILLDSYKGISESDELIRIMIQEEEYIDSEYSGVIGFFEEGFDNVRQNLATSRIEKTVKKGGSFAQTTKKAKAVYVTPEALEDLISDDAITNIYPDRINHEILIYNVPVTGAQSFFDLGYNGTDVTIAIIDSGISESHYAFEDRVILSKSFIPTNITDDTRGHGTHVASIAAGNFYNDGATGMALGANLINARVVRDDGTIYTSDIIAAIEWAVDPDENPATDDGADIISLSLGGIYATVEGLYHDAILAAIDAGVIVVTGSGNCGDISANPACGSFEAVTMPGRMNEIITVGAINENFAYAEFSGKEWISGEGIKPDIVAPGVDIRAAGILSSTNLVTESGTSMSTPMVSGGIALLLDKNPTLTHEQVKALLERSAVDLGTAGNDVYYGFGAMNLTLAMEVLDTYSARTLELGIGKNLIGFSSNAIVNFDLFSDSLANQMGIGMYDAAAVGDEWSYHIPQFLSGQTQNTLSTVSFDKGFQVNLFENETFVYFEQTVSSANYDLKKGWNLISYPFISSKTIADFFGADLSSIEAVITFTNDEEFAWYDDSYSQVNTLVTLEPGKGYWVNADADFTLSVSV